MSAAPQMVHQGTRAFVFSCAFFLPFIALGLLALLRTRQFHRIYDDYLRRHAYRRRAPGLSGLRFTGAFFVLIGTLCLAFSFYDQFLR